MQRIMQTIPGFAKFAILAVIGVFLAWRIVVVNMADQFAGGSDADAAATALKWDARQSDALYTHASSILTKDPAQAREELEAAIRSNPADGRSYAALASIYETQGDLAKADQAMITASAMAPRRVDVQSDAAAYWIRRGNIARAIENWNVVLTFAPEVWEKVFPALLAMSDDPATQKAFGELLKQPVSWWPDFFARAAENAPRLETVRALYNLQSKGPNDATPEALRAYLNRLQHDGYWTESYFVWLNSLDNDQLKYVGNLFNGGFETPLSNLGFDWVTEKAGYVLVESAPTFGSTGTKALHVLFRGPRVQFRHLGQYLLLNPGQYSLRGRSRPEDLETGGGGVQWVVYCLGSPDPLAKSDRFAGTDQWRHFRFQFTVPDEDCPVQMVRLELAGRVALDFEAKGGIWFDDMAIERQTLD